MDRRAHVDATGEGSWRALFAVGGDAIERCTRCGAIRATRGERVVFTNARGDRLEAEPSCVSDGMIATLERCKANEERPRSAVVDAWQRVRGERTRDARAR